MKYEFTIIIPIYNEADNLYTLESALLDYLPKSPLKTSIVLINDGSNDSSLNLIKQICIRNHDFYFISFSKNYGLSTALKAGFDYADSKWIGYMDADMQTSPNDFNLLLKYKNEYDLITGYRKQRQDTYFKKLSSSIANSIRRSFTKDGMNDTGCPLKIIKTDFAKRIPLFKGLHRFLPAMILLQKGKIKQIEVQHFPRTAGHSKFGLSNRLIGPLSDCFAYLWMKRKYISYKIEEQS